MRIVWILVLALIAGCSAMTPATQAPSAASTPITTQVLAAVLAEHDPDASAITGRDSFLVVTRPTEFVSGLTAMAWHRATPGRAKTWLAVSYSPAPFSTANACQASSCTERDGLVVQTNPNRLISVRAEGFVEVTGSAVYFSGDRRAIAVAMAADRRIAPRVDRSLADAAAANPRWRADPDGCRGAGVRAPIPLPPASGETQPVTPQALAAVIAARVAGSCASDESKAGNVQGVVRLGAELEWVSLSVTDKPVPCPRTDAACRYENGVTIVEELDVPEEFAVTLVLARPLADGVHWVIVTQGSAAPHRGGPFPIGIEVMRALVNDPRVQPRVDAALNRAGNDLPLPWRFSPTTSD